MDPFLTSRVVTDILGGLTNGVTYGMVALSLVLIWRSTGILNFAQGAMPMFATYVGFALLSYHFGYWPCVVACVIAALLIGGLTERLLVRRLYGKPEINPIVVMVGFLIVLEAVAAAIWSSTPRSLPSPFSTIHWQLAGRPFALSPFTVYEIVTALVVMLAVAVLFRFTNLGLQLRASALAPEVSRLLGVRVGRLLTLGWMLSTAVGVITTILVSANFFSGLTPTVMDGIFAYGFIAAAIGGLESPVGAIVAGILLGVVNQFVTDFVNQNAVIIIALAILVVSLMIRPSGVFTKSAQRRV
ncbi:MAG TPA: branched-chain amino acid ABC transporter permease [Acidimicrobiales bacterium]|jgi:branched-chain amino acid transport system permease protein|nr:branched-chain amino acid ABC transporter permease [Acidimicrobiales bacterium]HXC19722.1 branched-chain amino acid ABC transporter permease [Acidimicrobiales bacterium]